MNQHARFLQRLAQSSDAVWKVARWLCEKGHAVEIRPLRFAPSAAEHERYVDDGDLYVLTRGRHRVEVKRLTANFSGPHDWPYPIAFVSNERAVERANGTVLMYVVLSNDMHCAAVIARETREHWRIVEALASNTGNIERNYACPLDHVRWEQLP